MNMPCTPPFVLIRLRTTFVMPNPDYERAFAQALLCCNGGSCGATKAFEMRNSTLMGAPPRSLAERLFHLMDTDGSGAVSPEEFTAACAGAAWARVGGAGLRLLHRT